MLSERMAKALNDQINAEYFSSYLYLSMAAHCQTMNLPGMAHWMMIQVQEENAHVLKFFNYIMERRGTIELQGIEKPQQTWDSPLALFEAAFAHEQYISSRIHELVKIAREENDPATESFLRWFVDEQVEEEASVDEIVQQLKMIGDNPAALFFIDRELAKRTFVPPPGLDGGADGGAA
ncbi:ferritin [Thermostilla marina]